MSQTSSSGIGFVPLASLLFTVLFVGLKLTGFITWSWVWVLSPAWIGLAFTLAVLAFVALIVVCATAISAIASKKRK